MRQRVHVTQLAILHAKQVSIGRAAAAVRASGAEGVQVGDERQRHPMRDELAARQRRHVTAKKSADMNQTDRATKTILQTHGN